MNMAIRNGIRPNWFKLWSFFTLAADVLILIDGGISANPFMAWTGLGSILGSTINSVFGKKFKSITRLILLSCTLSMLASGANLFGFNDAVHVGQISYGVLATCGIVVLFWPVDFFYNGVPVPNAKIASILFVVVTTSFLADGIFQSGWLVILAAISYVISDICCFLIPPTLEDMSNEA